MISYPQQNTVPRDYEYVGQKVHVRKRSSVAPGIVSLVVIHGNPTSCNNFPTGQHS